MASPSNESVGREPLVHANKFLLPLEIDGLPVLDLPIAARKVRSRSQSAAPPGNRFRCLPPASIQPTRTASRCIRSPVRRRAFRTPAFKQIARQKFDVRANALGAKSPVRRGQLTIHPAITMISIDLVMIVRYDSLTPVDKPTLTHLRALEAESIFIMREVAAEFQRPVMLYSIGKDSSVMVRLAQKAFHPGQNPIPAAAHRYHL